MKVFLNSFDTPVIFEVVCGNTHTEFCVWSNLVKHHKSYGSEYD